MKQFNNFQVKSSKGKGKGIFATKQIQKGEIICKMLGSVVSFKEFTELFGSECDDLLQIGQDKYISLCEPYIYFNHSCDPNAALRNQGILFAINEIKNGEEITFDYSSTADDVTWQLECNCICGAKNCRKQIGDYQSLPHKVQEYYFSNGFLLDHILETFY